jgi:hypothetical protein
LVRSLVAEVTLRSEPASARLRIGIRWRSGAVEEVVTHRWKSAVEYRRTSADVVALVARLAPERTDAEIADALNAEGRVTGTGRPFDVEAVILQRTVPRPRLRTADRLFWVLLSRLWAGWTDAVSVVQPATVNHPDGPTSGVRVAAHPAGPQDLTPTARPVPAALPGPEELADGTSGFLRLASEPPHGTRWSTLGVRRSEDSVRLTYGRRSSKHLDWVKRKAHLSSWTKVGRSV